MKAGEKSCTWEIYTGRSKEAPANKWKREVHPGHAEKEYYGPSFAFAFWRTGKNSPQQTDSLRSSSGSGKGSAHPKKIVEKKKLFNAESWFERIERGFVEGKQTARKSPLGDQNFDRHIFSHCQEGS